MATQETIDFENNVKEYRKKTVNKHPVKKQDLAGIDEKVGSSPLKWASGFKSLFEGDVTSLRTTTLAVIANAVKQSPASSYFDEIAASLRSSQ